VNTLLIEASPTNYGVLRQARGAYDWTVHAAPVRRRIHRGGGERDQFGRNAHCATFGPRRRRPNGGRHRDGQVHDHRRRIGQAGRCVTIGTWASRNNLKARGCGPNRDDTCYNFGPLLGQLQQRSQEYLRALLYGARAQPMKHSVRTNIASQSYMFYGQ